MDYIDGKTLSEVLKLLQDKNPKTKEIFTLRKLTTIFSRICNAVKSAHLKNTVHLDLKPSNILIDNSENAYICDWGIAETLDDNHSELNTFSKRYTLGTPGYMAPEQTSQSNNPSDKRTDIYALGAILYSILTYKPSWTSSSLDEIVEKTRTGEIIKPRDRSPENNIPDELQSICSKAMSIKLDDRHQTIDDLISDIKQYLSGKPNNTG